MNKHHIKCDPLKIHIFKRVPNSHTWKLVSHEIRILSCSTFFRPQHSFVFFLICEKIYCKKFTKSTCEFSHRRYDKKADKMKTRMRARSARCKNKVTKMLLMLKNQSAMNLRFWVCDASAHSTRAHSETHISSALAPVCQMIPFKICAKWLEFEYFERSVLASFPSMCGMC